MIEWVDDADDSAAAAATAYCLHESFLFWQNFKQSTEFHITVIESTHSYLKCVYAANVFNSIRYKKIYDSFVCVLFLFTLLFWKKYT